VPLFRRFLFFALLVSVMVNGFGKSNPKVLLKTGHGDIYIEIFLDEAPITAGNFLKYVDEDRFQGAVFYRVVTMDNQPNNEVKIEVIQGGIMQSGSAQGLDPIEHETTAETGILHLDGAISMGRLKPGTASSEFFICVGAQPELDFGGKRNPDGQGFAAFGKVYAGIDVVKKIQQQQVEKQMLVTPVKIISVSRIK